MISQAFWKLYFVRNRTYKYWAELDDFANASAEEKRQVVSERLFAQLQYFGNRADALPEWKHAAAQASVNDVMSVWPTLPVLTKESLQQNYQPELIRDRFGIRGVVDKTGGSTGEPTRFLWDKRAMYARAAAYFYCWRRFGWQPGMPLLSIWGSPRDLGLANSRKYQFLTWMRNLQIIDGYAFDRSTAERAHQALVGHPGPICIYGYTSLLEQLARWFIDLRYDVPIGMINAAWNGGEAVTDSQSELFQSVFGTGIQNNYGGREFGSIAFKPTASHEFILLRPHLYIEIVNSEGRPCDPGEIGRILVTSLIGRGTPFLRYEIGDLASFSAQGADESGINSLLSVDGRKSGMIRVGGGRMVHNIFWGMLFKEYPEIRQFQVRQSTDGSVTILLVGAGMGTERMSTLQRLVAEQLGDWPFSIAWVDTIEVSKEGKLIQVHSDLL